MHDLLTWVFKEDLNFKDYLEPYLYCQLSLIIFTASLTLESGIFNKICYRGDSATRFKSSRCQIESMLKIRITYLKILATRVRDYTGKWLSSNFYVPLPPSPIQGQNLVQSVNKRCSTSWMDLVVLYPCSSSIRKWELPLLLEVVLPSSLSYFSMT